jgi:hypothetical protein
VWSMASTRTKVDSSHMSSTRNMLKKRVHTLWQTCAGQGTGPVGKRHGWESGSQSIRRIQGRMSASTLQHTRPRMPGGQLWARMATWRHTHTSLLGGTGRGHGRFGATPGGWVD